MILLNKFKSYFFLLSLVLILISCGQQMKQTEKKLTKAIDLNDLDTLTSPFDDFYQYATGGWQKNNPLPAEESRYGSFDQLAKETNKKINDIIIKLSEQKNEVASIEWKIATFYKMGMDTSKIENDKFIAIENIWKEIDQIKDKKELSKAIAKLHRQGFYPFFAIFSEADADNAEMTIANLHQSGLGLPNRDYYTDKDEKSKNIQEKYLDFMKNMFSKANFSNSEKIAIDVYKLEEKLAQYSFNQKELRDVYAANNKLSINDINKKNTIFNYIEYFKNIGLSEIDTINICQMKYFDGLPIIFSETNLETIKIYLKWNVLNESASWLHKDIVDLNFDFYGKTLSGKEEQQERWRRVVHATNGALGEAVGQIFVKEYFPAEAKERMETLVKNLQTAFAERITNLDWMSDPTKTKAKEKLSSMIVKIGYPDKWRDYSKLNITEDYFLTNLIRANEFDFDKMISEIGKPLDKTKWQMNPQTVNAYYNPSTNEICFPAGILQAPFFYADADDAVNYGAIGVVIGHEMTHGFDDQGRNYDKNGNLANWWTEEDAKKFEERTKILIDRYNDIIVLNELHANGEVTLGENIADYGGLKISFDAFKKALNGNVPEKIDGFTAEQRFYLSYAKIWGQNIRDEEIINRTKTDVHSIGEWRVNGQLPGIEDFIKTFNVPVGSKMRLTEDKWATIW